MKIIGIDPGPIESGYVIIDVKDPQFMQMDNINNYDLANYLPFLVVNNAPVKFAIEIIESFGMPIGKSTMDTIEWIGKFTYIIENIIGKQQNIECHRIGRREVKLILCGVITAKSKHINESLRNRYGYYGSGVTGKGTKADPGPLYSISEHTWPALAVAETLRIKIENKKIANNRI